MIGSAGRLIVIDDHWVFIGAFSIAVNPHIAFASVSSEDRERAGKNKDGSKSATGVLGGTFLLSGIDWNNGLPFYGGSDRERVR